MPQKMVVQSLQRLTFVRKGKAMAKHPDTRSGVIEVVKAEEISPWYADFDAWLLGQDELGESPLADFAASGTRSDSVDASASNFEAANKESAKNYPDSQGPFAGPHNSFPIRSAADVIHAAQRLHNAKGDKASIKAKIRSIARAHGYPLPKTWGDKKESAVDRKVLDLVNQLMQVVKSEESAESAPEAPAAETPAAETPVVETPATDAPVVETPAAETGEVEAKESARTEMHTHDHAHISSYGYQYSHSHPHGAAEHAASPDHNTSEIAHAHEHVSKATDEETEANLKGLKADLDAARAEIATLTEKLSAVEGEKQEAVVAAARRPLVAPTAGGTPVTKSAPQITPQMKYDDAFAQLMRS